LKVGSEERTPKVTLQEAFARSVNPAFGVLGLALGGKALESTARNLGFNRPFICVRPSHFQALDTGFALAETSCGFTPRTTISPLHALAIARGIGDDGKLRFGAFAKSLVDISDRAAPKALDVRTEAGSAFVSAANLPKLQALMEATVRSGTARKGFHQVMRAVHFDKLTVGGKTGSLDGLAPSSQDPAAEESAAGLGPSAVTEAAKGRFDWFIGYARLKDDPSRGLALSIMLVHGEYANVRSTVLAALLIRDWLMAEEKARKQAGASATASRSDARGTAAGGSVGAGGAGKG
jgi:cell division protein FtsI/penicillin-binding protein 2